MGTSNRDIECIMDLCDYDVEEIDTKGYKVSRETEMIMVQVMTLSVDQTELKHMVGSRAGNYTSQVKIWMPRRSLHLVELPPMNPTAKMMKCCQRRILS